MKEALNEIEQEFLPRAVMPGGIMMLQPEDVLAIIKRCEEAQYFVLGIDGFYLTEQGTQPSMENSVDYSLDMDTLGAESVRRYADAVQFIEERRSKGLHFEIVCQPSQV